jgi:hypothetical protein
VVILESCLKTGRAASSCMLLWSLESTLNSNLLTSRWHEFRTRSPLQTRFTIGHLRRFVGEFQAAERSRPVW